MINRQNINTQNVSKRNNLKVSATSEEFSFLLRSLEREKHQKQIDKMRKSKESIIMEPSLNIYSTNNRKSEMKNSVIMNKTLNLHSIKEFPAPKFSNKMPKFFQQKIDQSPHSNQQSLISGVRMTESQQLDKKINDNNSIQSILPQQRINLLLKLIKKFLTIISVPQLGLNTIQLNKKSKKVHSQLINLITDIQNDRQVSIRNHKALNSTMKLGANKDMSSSYHLNSGKLNSFNYISEQRQGSSDVMKKIEDLELQKQELCQLVSQHQAANIKMYIKLNQGESQLIEQYKRILKDLFEKYRNLQYLLRKNILKQKQNLRKTLEQQKVIQNMQKLLDKRQESYAGKSIVAISQANKKIKLLQEKIKSLNTIILQQNQSLELALLQIQKNKQNQQELISSQKNIAIISQQLNTQRKRLSKLLESSKVSSQISCKEKCQNCQRFMTAESIIRGAPEHRKTSSFTSNDFWKQGNSKSFISSDYQSNKQNSINYEYHQNRKTMPRKKSIKQIISDNQAGYKTHGRNTSVLSTQGNYQNKFQEKSVLKLQDFYRIMLMQANSLEKIL